jgi:hypothetical protein
MGGLSKELAPDEAHRKVRDDGDGNQKLAAGVREVRPWTVARLKVV